MSEAGAVPVSGAYDALGEIMNGIHDMGGMHGFGRVVVGDESSTFHEQWEGRTFAMMLLGSLFAGINLDESRKAIESAPAEHYLTLGYYGRWRRALELLLVDKGVLRESEVDARVARETFDSGPVPPPPAPPASFDALRAVSSPPVFELGCRVRARNLNPGGHTRLPRYVRGREGIVESLRPSCVFPDSNAEGRGEDPQHLYSVRFDGRELWGPDAEESTCVTIDLFEPYLERA